ncbi:MAG TPA: amino acid adenylation domain-containing protein [Pyrinomonadaceae bacterium]|jgi:amino acid adenylation domain-containing protein
MQQYVEGFRLSTQQARVWQLARGNTPASHAQCILRLEGRTSADLLRASVSAVVARQQILHTTYRPHPGVTLPLQVIDASVAAEIAWREVDIHDLNGQQATALEQIMREERVAEFDLERGPLVRAALVRLSPETHMFSVTFPAMCADGRTLDNFFDELIRAYELDGAAFETETEELTQYLQFSEWQNELLASEEARAGKDFWARAELSAGASLILPGEERMVGATGGEMVSLEVKLEGAVFEACGEYARRRELSREALLLAAWQTLLWRLTGQKEIVVNALFDGRKYEELNDAFGLFASYLPVPARLSAGTSFAELAAHTHAAMQEADEWQEFAGVDESFTRTSPTELRIGFQLTERPARRFANGLVFTVARQVADFERFKLKLSCVVSGDALVLEFQYLPASYAADHIQLLAEQFQQLLRSALASLESASVELEMIGASERERLLVEWNDTASDFPAESCFQDLFAAQVERTPDAVAVVYGESRLTYRELDARSNQLAHHLRKLGVRPDACVGLCVERSPEMVVGLLGVLKAGAAYLPLDPSHPRERLHFMLSDARAEVLLTQERLAALLPNEGATVVVRLDTGWDEIASESAERFDSGACAENLAYVIYTSGSTGRPKGVSIHHRGLVNYLTWAIGAYRLDAGTGAPVHSPLSFDLTVTGLLAPLAAGQRVVLLPETDSITALRDALAAESDFSLVKLTPAHLEVLSRMLPPTAAARQTRALVVGGEALWSRHLAFWHEHAPETEVVNEYGPTETVVGCCVYQRAAGEIEAGAVPIGQPIANTRLYVLDERMRLAPTGASGELYIGGAGVARGYLGRPALTAERFVPDPFASMPGERLYRTGDSVRRRADGVLEYLGRIDSQVKIRGYRIEPGEIEAALSTHEGVRENVVAVREDAPGERQLVGYIVLAATGRGVLASELRAFLLEKLPDYMIPTSFVMLDELPLTVNGKVDYRALPAPDVSRADMKEVYVAPRTPVEEVLAAIWSEVLGIEQIGVHDNFFALGGDSIRSVRVLALAKEKGFEFTLQNLFQYQTISELAAEIKGTELPSLGARRTHPFELVSAEDRSKLPDYVEDAYPLSMLQTGMLYHMQLATDIPAYHNACSYHVRARFDPDALRRAVQAVVDRHAVLRTSFDMSSYSEPLQLVHRTATMEVGVFDVRHLSVAEQETVLGELVVSEWKRLFDLARPPLIRINLHRRTDESFQFTLTECHAVIDGWSLTSTFAEIFNLYFAYLKTGTMPVEPPPAVSFRDFIYLERAALESEECREFWTRTLADCTPLRLPRPTATAHVEGRRRVQIYPVRISAETSRSLRELARSLTVPLKSVLLAAHVRALSLITGETDIVTGIGTNGRPEETDGEQARGLFLNTVPFRLQVATGAESGADLVRRTFAAEWELLPHRRFPLAAIQKKWGRQTLLETDFEFLHFHSVERLMRSGDIEILDNKDVSETNFALVACFHADPVTSQLALGLLCDTTQLSQQQIEDYGRHYASILSALAADPSATLDAAHLLTPAEKHRLLSEFNRTARDYPQEDGYLHELFERQAEQTPDSVALIFDDERLTYRELNERANRLAHYLRRHENVDVDTLVGVLMERSSEMVVSLLGILKAGAAYVPFDPSYPQERLSFMAQDAQVTLLLTQQRWRDAFNNSEPVSSPRMLCLDTEWDKLSDESCENPQGITLSADNLAYMIYTSGSTGQPKGAMNTHGAIRNRLLWMQEQYQLTPDDRVLQKTPFSFDVSVWEFFWPLIVGAQLVVAKPGGHQDAAYLLELIKSEEVTTLHFVPSMLGVFLSGREASECRSIRQVMASGEALTAELVRRCYERMPQVRLHNLYGPTEAAVDVTAWECQREVSEVVPIGRPIANTQIYIVDAQLQPVPVGVAGELYIAGEGLARGYLNRPELTAERFLPNPFRKEGGGRLYRTGDRARFLSDGTIEYLGRVDYQVKVRGFRIELGEIEAALSAHAQVSEVVVIAREDEVGDKRLIAYLVLEETDAPAPEVNEWRAFLKERLPEYMIPAAFVMLDQLPLSPNGKVDRRALPVPDQARPVLRQAFVPARNGVEQQLVDIWAEVLRVERIGVHDDFFELGGDSLIATRLVSRVRRGLNVEVPLATLFKHTTVAALAEYIAAAEAEPGDEEEERIARLLEQVDQLSEQNVAALLESEEFRRLTDG